MNDLNGPDKLGQPGALDFLVAFLPSLNDSATKSMLLVQRPKACFSTQSQYGELISKRFSLVKVKAGENFNRRNTLSISRIEI
jgi:hypothetical protein